MSQLKTRPKSLICYEPAQPIDKKSAYATIKTVIFIVKWGLYFMLKRAIHSLFFVFIFYSFSSLSMEHEDLKDDIENRDLRISNLIGNHSEFKGLLNHDDTVELIEDTLNEFKQHFQNLIKNQNFSEAQELIQDRYDILYEDIKRDVENNWTKENLNDLLNILEDDFEFILQQLNNNIKVNIAFSTAETIGVTKILTDMAFKDPWKFIFLLYIALACTITSCSTNALPFILFGFALLSSHAYSDPYICLTICSLFIFTTLLQKYKDAKKNSKIKFIKKILVDFKDLVSRKTEELEVNNTAVLIQ